MNLVIVEDSILVRDQLLRLIGAEPQIRVVGCAEDGDAAESMILREEPDAILLDLALRSGCGIDVLAHIRASGIRSRVLVLTNDACAAVRSRCEDHGISGFYDKTLETSACLAELFSWVPERSHQ